MYDYSHIRIKELLDELAKLPNDATLNVSFDDEAIRVAIKRKKAHEAIQKLIGSGNGKLMNRLFVERAQERLGN